ncbi:MAG: hypothetical protein K0U16_07795 [Gammaproteobacteria bacterium]|nr:hypothetical protein [Gammaproteobacteria bacterium]
MIRKTLMWLLSPGGPFPGRTSQRLGNLRDELYDDLHEVEETLAALGDAPFPEDRAFYQGKIQGFKRAIDHLEYALASVEDADRPPRRDPK